MCLVEENDQRHRVGHRKASSELARAAADVHHPRESVEVQGLDDILIHFMKPAEASLKCRRECRVFTKCVEKSLAVCALKRCCPRPHAVEELTPRLPMKRVATEERERPERVGVVGSERLGERCELERSCRQFPQDTCAGQRAEKPMKGLAVAPRFLRQLPG